MNDPQPEGHMASHIERRKFLAALGGAAAWPLRTRAEQVTRPTVGFLNSASADKYAYLAASFRQGLSDLGFVDRRTSRSNIAGQRANMIDCLLITTVASSRSDRWVRRTRTPWWGVYRQAAPVPICLGRREDPAHWLQMAPRQCCGGRQHR